MSKPLYRTARWKRLRLYQLRREPLCRYCAARGDVTEATVVDHVVPHRWDKELFWRCELQSLCAAHHSGSKQSEEFLGYSKEIGTDGYAIDHNHPTHGSKNNKKIKLFDGGSQFSPPNKQTR